MRMSSRLVRAGIVVFTLASMTALGCSILVDFDETKIPTDDAGDSATTETSIDTGTPTTDSGVDSGTDTGTPTDSGDDATDGGDASDGGDAADGGSDATDGGSDATDAADTTPADTTPADTTPADTAADTAEAAADSADDASDAAADSADDASDAATDSATDSASDAAGDSAGDASDGGTGTSFTANLDGGQVLPANTSTATGKISCTLNVAETALDCTITHTVSGATSIRIAEAFGGLTGTSVFTFDAATSPQTKSFTVTSGQVTSLKAGKLYVDVPSSLTGGEIRGQLLKPGQKLFTAAPLSGANQVPAVTSTVTGGASCIVDGTAVTCNGAASGFAGDGSSSSPAAAHIHEGGPTTNGGVSVSLTLGTFASDAVSISGTATVGTELDATKLAASTSVAASQYYVNLHTSVFGGGAARAQLVLRMTAPSP